MAGTPRGPPCRKRGGQEGRDFWAFSSRLYSHLPFVPLFYALDAITSLLLFPRSISRHFCMHSHALCVCEFHHRQRLKCRAEVCSPGTHPPRQWSMTRRACPHLLDPQREPRRFRLMLQPSKLIECPHWLRT